MKNLLHFFRNLWKFKRAIWQWRPWSYAHYSLPFYEAMLKDMHWYMSEKGHLRNSEKYAEDVQVCLNLIKRLEGNVHMGMYATYHYDPTSTLGFKVVRSDVVPKSGSPFKQEYEDWKYLHKILSKEGYEKFWD